jgi:hypothetical protein
MALDKTKIQVEGASNPDAPTRFSYTSTDDLATINSSGYFNSISDTLSVGDNMYVFAKTGATAEAATMVVVSNASGVVDMSDGQAIALTDSD